MGNNDSSFTDIPAQNISSSQADFALFHHHDLLTASGAEKPWKQEKLVNKLNHLNFIDDFIYLIISEKLNGKSFLAKAYPLPCVKDELLCRLTSPEVINNISNYKFDFLMIDDGLTTVLAPIQLISAENENIKLSLPDHSHVKKIRKTRRHKCEDIDCQVIQNDLKAKGTLIDFTPTALGIRLSSYDSAVSFYFNKPVELTLSNKEQILYSGPCSCIRNGINSYDGKIVLAPLVNHIEHFPKRKMRNPRQQITPSFVLRFRHPLFQKNIERDIQEISTAGFSIIENTEEEVLIPGLHIPTSMINYAGVLKMLCSIQALYRREDKINNCLHFGFTITDMDLKAYTNLNHILGTYTDSNARVSTEVDMDALWEFFFDTGFIYGEKYEHLHIFRHNFIKTYETLYRFNPDIARHFVYEKNGKIYGHIAMIHAYNPSWLIHHFSARRMGNRLPGVSVLKQITQYISAYTRFPSSGMNHVMTYYQPSNRIIDRIFGSFTRHLKDIKGSSLDVFSYIHFNKNNSVQNLPQHWEFRECTPIDFNVLNYFYKSSSGGLMLNAFGLDSSSDQIRGLFLNAGFKRNYKTFCLSYKDKQVAFFIANQSDMGINLSDILNGITIIAMESSILPFDILMSAIDQVAHYYNEDQISLLIYPTNYLSSHNIKEEKQYALWILNLVHSSDEYLLFMNKLMKLQQAGN